MLRRPSRLMWPHLTLHPIIVPRTQACWSAYQAGGSQAHNMQLPCTDLLYRGSRRGQCLDFEHCKLQHCSALWRLCPHKHMAPAPSGGCALIKTVRRRASQQAFLFNPVYATILHD